MIHNDTAIPMSVKFAGAVGTPTRKDTDFGIAASVTRLVSNDQYALLPGDTLKFPIGAGTSAFRIIGDPNGEDYILAKAFTSYVSTKSTAVYDAIAGAVKDLDDNFDSYHACLLKHTSFLGQAACKADLVKNLTVSVAKGGASVGLKGVLAILLSSTLYSQWVDESVNDVSEILHSGTLNIAAADASAPAGSGGAGSPPPTSTGSTAASGSGSGTPSTGPTPGSSSTAPITAPSNGPGSSTPTPTYAETTGSVAHTWTNYTNAGGTQGPDIASKQTIQVQCWASGFRVADGNTYWYKIASSPWSGAYYVSADAFYNNGAISGTLSGTPFVDPGVPSCAGGTSGGGSKPTYAETTGSVAHTWSNYSNAGGTQGPEIGPDQTVQIACWVSGFRVADGNTYWYEIASSPWNDAYYVSADAFYNDGATSGTLSGTPFVDPAVPNCSNTAGGSTGGSKPTFGETTGSVAHTWTNYANAGGTEGPEIGSDQTVQIACWVSGFRVADGNTYWYEIASSPWNDAYYVSADAFYNNGQTSGSLRGTPFVDPAVPQC